MLSILPKMDFTDSLTLDAETRRTADGYLVGSFRVARSGIQVYSGRDVDPDNKHGMRDRAEVRVYRPPEEVFKQDAMASFAFRPITVDHPGESVTSKNWRKFSVGQTGGDVVRDGDFIRVPMVVMDEAAIGKIEKGKRELSQGYGCDVVFGDGTTPDGLQFDAKQTNIRANHTAIVDRARGGPELKIGDSEVATKTITFDGLPLETTDAGEAAINKLLAKLNDAATTKTALETRVGELTATVATRDGEIVALKANLADAAMTPAKLDAAVTARALVVDAAKKIAPTLDATGKTDAEIRKIAVISKLGDAVAGKMSDAEISGAFAGLAVAVATTDSVRDAVRGGIVPQNTNFADGDKKVADAHADMVRGLTHPGEKKTA